MMLVQMLKEQIAKNWALIAPAIENSLPPTADSNINRMTLILENLLKGEMQCWLIYPDDIKLEDADKQSLLGVMVTTVVVDTGTLAKNLLIYSLYGFKVVDLSVYRDCLSTLRIAAREVGCSKIIAYTNVDGAAQLAKRLGANTDTTFVSFNV